MFRANAIQDGRQKCELAAFGSQPFEPANFFFLNKLLLDVSAIYWEDSSQPLINKKQDSIYPNSQERSNASGHIQSRQPGISKLNVDNDMTMPVSAPVKRSINQGQK